MGARSSRSRTGLRRCRLLHRQEEEAVLYYDHVYLCCLSGLEGSMVCTRVFAFAHAHGAWVAFSEALTEVVLK